MFDFLSGRFAEIQGLPLHPLAVHAVVILLPLSAIAAVLAIAVRRWRPWLQWVALIGLIIGTVGTYIAKLSGDSLAAAVGLPTFHAEWGNNLVPAAFLLLALTGAWIWLSHLTRWPVLRRVVAGAVTLVSLSTIGLTYIVGHSGAEAVWADSLAEARVPPPTAVTAPQPITMTEVALHNTVDDCWSVVDGQVYDLTEFVTRHPVGPSQIEEMCGVDATEAFSGEHAGQAEPEGWLDVFRIGELG